MTSNVVPESGLPEYITRMEGDSQDNPVRSFPNCVENTVVHERTYAPGIRKRISEQVAVLRCCIAAVLRSKERRSRLRLRLRRYSKQ